MARTQAADYEDQRDAILDCAADAFSKAGYAACSMSEIARLSGASKARLYHYYASKEAILFDLLDKHTQKLLGIISAHAVPDSAKKETSTAAKSRLHSLIHATLLAYRDARTRHIALLNDVKFLQETEREIIVSRERAVVEGFAQALSAAFPKRIHATNRRAQTMMLLGAMNWTFTWLKPDGRVSYSDYANELVATFFDGLATPSAA